MNLIDRPNGRMMQLLIILFATLFFWLRPAFAESTGEFANVDAFIHSLPDAKVLSYADGPLFSSSLQDWAGVVASKSEDVSTVSVYVLEKKGSGRYRVIAKSAERNSDGGTGNFYIDGISIKNRSIFVEFSYHWHACAGNSKSQFSRTAHGIQLIGIESWETNSVENGDDGVELNTSVNFLTSKVLYRSTHRNKVRISTKRTAGKVILLKDFDGDGTISMLHPPMCG